MIISKEIQFDAGHRIPNHESKCRNPHGHRYKVVAEVYADTVRSDEGSSEEGMVMDFGFLKELLTDHVHDIFDHGFVYYKKDRQIKQFLEEYGELFGWKVIKFPLIPTAENFAKWIFSTLDARVHNKTDGFAKLQSITVWETPTSMARHEREV